MQVGPQPDEGRQQQRIEAPLPIGAEPHHEHTGEHHVEQLGTGTPGRRARQRADQRQHRGHSRVQARSPQDDVHAKSASRHRAGTNGDQQRQAAKLVEQVHHQIGQPLVHHPGLAGGAERVEIDVRNRAGRADQAPVGQVPPQVGIQRRHRGQTEDGRKEEPAKHQRTGDPAKRANDGRHQGV